jgi:hypothetical protein
VQEEWQICVSRTGYISIFNNAFRPEDEKEKSKNYISNKGSCCMSSNTVLVIKLIKMQCLDGGYKGTLEILIQIEIHFSVLVLVRTTV